MWLSLKSHYIMPTDQIMQSFSIQKKCDFLWNLMNTTFQCQPKYQQDNLNEDQHFPPGLTPVEGPTLFLNHSYVIPAQPLYMNTIPCWITHIRNKSSRILKSYQLKMWIKLPYKEHYFIVIDNVVRKCVHSRMSYLLCLGNYNICITLILQWCFYSFQSIKRCINPMFLEKSTNYMSTVL